MIATISRGMIPHMHRHSLLRSSLGVGAATVLSRTIRNTTTVAALALIRSAAATTHPLQHQLLESIGWTRLVSLGKYLGLTHIPTRDEVIKRLKSHIESTPSMLLPNGSIDFESAVFTNHQIYPEELQGFKIYQLHSLCSALGISVWNSNDELIDEIYLHIKRNPSAMAGNRAVVLRSRNTVDTFTNHSTAEQSMAAVLKRLRTCGRWQLRSLCDSFEIPKKRSQDILVEMVQDHLRQHPSLLFPNGAIPLQLLLNHGGGQPKPSTANRHTPKLVDMAPVSGSGSESGSESGSADCCQLESSLARLNYWQAHTLSDICDIPHNFTHSEYAGIIKSKLLDSASPLVGEGGMVDLQSIPKPSNQEISDISNMSIHIDRLEALSSMQLTTLCKMFGVSRVKARVQLVEELRLYLTSNPSAVTEDGAVILGNEKSLNTSSSKKTLSKPVHLHSLNTTHLGEIWALCRSYGISIMIPKEQLFERFRTHLREHPEVVRTDGTINPVNIVHRKRQMRIL
ncbi:hypothetical protein BASA60_002945 [Batrachochytrium salamandrivorans]|nr:hypothetical protein BASA60_002945 [Batrachochytrium salamandrivorans]